MRPILRYHGGKWLLAPWIISHFPDHRIYVEPFGGAASVLLRKPPAYAEIYNDLDKEIVNVFRQVREHGKEIARRLHLTPFARYEHKKAYSKKRKTLMDRAVSTIVKSYMGFGSDSIARLSGFRSNAYRSGTTPAHDWANFPPHVRFFIERLRGVVIENRDAKEIMLAHDSPATLHYVDPPYVHSTRSTKKGYSHEMDDKDHRELAKFLRTLKGMVIVSGYESPLYDELYAGWRREEKEVATFNGSTNKNTVTEVLWMNFAKHASLFDVDSADGAGSIL